MIVFLILQPYLLGIFFTSPSTLYTKLLLYIKDKYTYSNLGIIIYSRIVE